MYAVSSWLDTFPWWTGFAFFFAMIAALTMGNMWFKRRNTSSARQEALDERERKRGEEFYETWRAEGRPPERISKLLCPRGVFPFHDGIWRALDTEGSYSDRIRSDWAEFDEQYKEAKRAHH